MQTQPISIAGVAGPVVVGVSPFWGLRTVTVDGRPAARIGRNTYALPSISGPEIAARVRAGVTDPYPTVEVNGIRHRTGPAVPAILQVLALLPFVLVLGGLLGGLVGALGIVANLGVVRTPIPTAAKALVMLGIAVAAFVVFLILAAAVQTSLS